jgi:tRNA-binding protein
MPTFQDFQKIDIRVGKIVNVDNLPKPKYTTQKLTIDFGKELGKKVSCARLVNYKDEDLIGKLVICVVNFPPKQIGKNISEVLTLGLPGTDEECVLVSPDINVEVGARLY